jgi:hypothetical protein
MTPSFSSFADELMKIAEEKHAPWKDILKTLGSGLGVFGLGTAVGYGGMHLANLAYKGQTGHEIPRSAMHAVAPILGAASGIAYSIYKARELEKIRDALKNPTKPGQGGSPGK